MTYAEIYRSGREALEAAGIGEAELDARLLLETVCHTTRNDLLVHGDRKLQKSRRSSTAGGLPGAPLMSLFSISPACRSSWDWNFWSMRMC